MSDEIVEAAFRYLRAHSTGDLRFDEHVRPIKYVIGPDGRLVCPAMVAMIESMDTVLFIPDARFEAMEAQVTLEPLDEHGDDGALTDRWRIFHGEPHDVRWAFVTVDAVRFRENVIDGAELMRPNSLAESEAGLCREFNREHRDELRLLCAHFAHTDVEAPLIVGIDPLGVDLKRAFDVVRIEAAQPMSDAEAVRRVLGAMIVEARRDVEGS